MPNERSAEVKHRRGSNLCTKPSDKSLQVEPNTVLHIQAVEVVFPGGCHCIMCLPMQRVANILDSVARLLFALPKHSVKL